MKKSIIGRIFAVAMAVAVVFSAAALTACGEEEPVRVGGGYTEDEEIYVESLTVTQQPAKTDYIAGEVFDPTGLRLVAVWHGLEEENEEVLTSGDCKYTHKGERLTDDVTEIVFTYEGVSASLPISVTAHDIIGIEVTVPPTVEQIVGQPFDGEGMVVVAECSDCDGVMLTESDYTVSSFGAFDDGVDISYTLADDTFTTRLAIEPLTLLEAEATIKGASKPEGNVNYVDSTSGIAKTVQYDQTASGGAYFGGFPDANADKNEITFYVYAEVMSVAKLTLVAASGYAYGAGTDEFGVQTIPGAREMSVADNMTLTVNGKPAPLSDQLVLEGTGSADNPDEKASYWTHWTNVQLGEFAFSAGYNTVTVEATDTGFNIDCLKVAQTAREIADTSDHNVTGITITTPPDKTEYAVGKTFDPTGMVVRTVCSDCDGWDLLNIECSYSEIGPMSREVTVSAVVNGDTLTASQPIEVYSLLEAETTIKGGAAPDGNVDYVDSTVGSVSAIRYDQTASGGKYLGSFPTKAGDSITFRIYADGVMDAELTLVAASGDAYGSGTDELGSLTIPGVREMKVAEHLTLSVNGAPVAIGDDLVLEGIGSADNEDEKASYWTHWMNVELGTFTLKSGYNDVVLTSLSKKGINIDYLKVVRSEAKGVTDPTGHDVTGIEIATPPDRTDYAAGEAFDPAGMTVRTVCSDCDGWELLPAEYVCSALTPSSSSVTVSALINGETFTAAQPVTVTRVLEAETTIKGGAKPEGNADYVDSTVGSVSAVKLGQTASGDKYLGGFPTKAGDSITFAVYCDGAASARFILTAASGWAISGGTDELGSQTITGVREMKLNEYLTLSVNGTPVEVDEELVLEGIDDGTESAVHWTHWTEVDLGVTELTEGYNTVTLTSLSNRGINIDCMRVVFGG
mgnify:CR=1 FL=1